MKKRDRRQTLYRTSLPVGNHVSTNIIDAEIAHNLVRDGFKQEDILDAW